MKERISRDFTWEEMTYSRVAGYFENIGECIEV